MNTETVEQLENVSEETHKVKRLVVVIFIGLIIITLLFVGLVAKNVPQQPLFEFDDDEPMQQDVRPEQLLERLATKTWGNTDSANDLATILPSEVNYQPVEDAMTAFVDHNEIPQADITENDNPPAALNNQLELESEQNKQAGQSPISVYSGNQNHAAKSKQDMLDALLPSSDYSGLIKAALEAQMGQDSYQQQNQQTSKKSFLQGQEGVVDGDESPAPLKKLKSPYTLAAGSWLPATLVTGINSDLPGRVIAKINQAVYDTAIGNHLLIPQGSTLLGQYDSQVSFGQSRVLLVWSRIIFPNGDSINLNNMPGVDLLGMSGLKDKVNYHTTRLFSSAILFSTFSAVGQMSQSDHDDDNKTSTRSTMAEALGQQMSETGNQLIQKNLHIQPTITIRPGTRFYVMLTKDLVLQKLAP